LFAHGGNQMNASAEMAFNRAAEIAPNHPGPPFFFGFALAQAGKYDEAGATWRALLARAPANSELKVDLEARLADINQLTVDPAKPSPQKAN
jgi:cytochrome c-type biogenesis protein CcmH/NrfG